MELHVMDKTRSVTATVEGRLMVVAGEALPNVPALFASVLHDHGFERSTGVRVKIWGKREFTMLLGEIPNWQRTEYCEDLWHLFHRHPYPSLDLPLGYSQDYGYGSLVIALQQHTIEGKQFYLTRPFIVTPGFKPGRLIYHDLGIESKFYPQPNANMLDDLLPSIYKEVLPQFGFGREVIRKYRFRQLFKELVGES